MSATQLNAAARHVREIVDFDALPLVEVLVLRGSKIVLHDLFGSMGMHQTHFRARDEFDTPRAWRRYVLPLFDWDLHAHKDPFDGKMEVHPHFNYITGGGRGSTDIRSGGKLV